MCIVRMIPIVGLLLIVSACSSVRQHPVWQGNTKDYQQAHEVAEVKKMPVNLKASNMRPYYPIPPSHSKQAELDPPTLLPPDIVNHPTT